MFPIRDDNPQILTPYATYAIIALNVAVWVFIQGLGTPEALGRSICELGLIPAELLQTVPGGARLPIGPDSLCVLGDSARWFTPLTSMFMHGGWIHIIGNMWFLWIFGDNVEDAMGSVRFVIFYLLCGFAAAAAQVLMDVNSIVPMVGASGAIGGVMGAYILLYPRVRVHMLLILGFFITRIAVPAVFMLGYWILVQLLSGFTALGGQGGGVAFWAHIGGFATGAVLILLFRDPQLLAKHPYYGWNRNSPTRNWQRIDRR
jgi:membrane associated rhomboid family serine protease